VGTAKARARRREIKVLGTVDNIE